MLLWDGACHVHEKFSVEKIIELKKQYPDADVLVHPECKGAVAKLADKVGSTAGLLKHAMASDKKNFIVATESGILYEMRKNARIRILFRLLLKIVPVHAMNVTSCV